MAAPGDAKILEAIGEFRGKLNTDFFYPKRKYQGHPVCSETNCGNMMSLEKNRAHLHYECKPPKCGKKLKAKIERD